VEAAVNPTPPFCPIPLQARADVRLTGAHWRLLSTIASHDRLSDRRGSGGCYALQQTLASEANIHLTNIGDYARDLVKWGYIRIDRYPDDRRRLVYRVIYDAAIVGQSTNLRHRSGSQTLGQIVGALANKIVGEAPAQDIDSKVKSAPEYIPLRDIKKKDSLNEGVRRDCAKRETDLAEAPASNGSELRRRLQWGEQCDRLERLGLSREVASEVLMAADEAGHTKELADSGTPDARIVDILRDLKERGS
jgi:hypothetical protein